MKILYDPVKETTVWRTYEDGKCNVPQEGLIELDVIINRPSINPNTHYYSNRIINTDLENKIFQVDYMVLEKPERQEIFKDALTEHGIPRSQVEDVAQDMSETDLEMFLQAWNNDQMFFRDCGWVLRMQDMLGMIGRQMDHVFTQGNKMNRREK
jgi:hypothetical protein